MSGPITLTFVGGPEDGKRVVLKSPPGRSYRVAVLPNLPTYVPRFGPRPLTEAPDSPFRFEEFTYSIQLLPGANNFVAYPTDWDQRPYPMEAICTALLRGYVGRSL